MVAARTGTTEPEAQKRVDDVIVTEKVTEAHVRPAADTARRAASAFSIFAAIAMLVGAFIARAAASLGGQQRDEHA